MVERLGLEEAGIETSQGYIKVRHLWWDVGRGNGRSLVLVAAHAVGI